MLEHLVAFGRLVFQKELIDNELEYACSRSQATAFYEFSAQ